MQYKQCKKCSQYVDGGHCLFYKKHVSKVIYCFASEKIREKE